MLLTDLACYGRISKVFVFYFLTLSPCRIFCQELFCDGLSLVEICDFGTVLYPFTTTINKVLYSVFVFNFSNGFWDLKFEIKIYKGHSAESEKCALMLDDLILCCKDCRRSLFGIFLVSMEIFVFVFGNICICIWKYLYLLASFSSISQQGPFCLRRASWGNSIGPTVPTLDIGHKTIYFNSFTLYAEMKKA